jgi:hypothetical protein
LPRQPARQVEGHRLAAELLDDPRDVEAAAARLVMLVAGADLAHRHDLVGDVVGVDGRVHGERDDRGHRPELFAVAGAAWR